MLWVLVLTTAGLVGERLVQVRSGTRRAPEATNVPDEIRDWPDLLGPSRSPVPPAVLQPMGSEPSPEAPEADYAALTAAFAQWADYAEELPPGLERLAEEDLPLGEAMTTPSTPVGGLDLDDYADRLDELALRVSYLVTGQLRDELEPALKDWLREARLEGNGDADRILRGAAERLDTFGDLFDRVVDS